MANVDNARGLVVAKHAGGGSTRLQPLQYSIASGQSGAMGLGSPVKTTGTASPLGHAGVQAAAATDRLAGVFSGCQYIRADGDPIFSNQWVSGTVTKATEAALAFVGDDPNLLFEIQVNGVGLVAANVGQLADLSIGTVDAITGTSRDEVSQATIGTGDTVHIIGLADGQEFGANSNAIVRISKHERGFPSTAT